MKINILLSLRVDSLAAEKSGACVPLGMENSVAEKGKEKPMERQKGIRTEG